MNYSRQTAFLENIEGFDSNFQEKIKDKKIVIVGCGGVGSPIANLLIRGGFENLVLVDSDFVDESNLQRQTFFEEDIGKAKVECLKNQILKINSKCNVQIVGDILSEENIKEICLDSDLIIDATDNFLTRRIINEFCEKENKIWIYNGAVKDEVMCCLFEGKDKLFNKVFPKNVEDFGCSEFGVLGSTTFVSASLCYNEVLKYFLEIKRKEIIKLNLWNLELFKIKLK